MASRGHLPSSLTGKPAQAPGMLRHGPFPGYSPSVRHPLEPVNPAEILEKKIALQDAEMDKIAGENQRLASTHGFLRQELVATQHEIQRIHTFVGSIHNESEIKIQGLLEKIAKAEADIRNSEEVKKELQKAHLDGQSLFAERHELTSEIQHMTDTLQKVKADVKNLPELRVELEGLRQEHKKLRSAFELEKNLNKEQVEQMRGMEKNLLTMANEVEKLRAEILKVEKTTQVPNQYGGAYATAAPGYSSAHYPDQGYAQGVSGHVENGNGVISNYPDSGFSRGGYTGYPQGYGMVSAQMADGATDQSGNSYTTVNAVYQNGSIMSLVPAAGGMLTGGGMNAYAGAAAAAAAAAGPYYGANVGVPSLPSGAQPPFSWR